MEPALEKILNLLLESERAGVATLDVLAGQVKSEELKQLLVTSREDENETVRALEQLIRSNGGTPSDKTGPFAARVVAAGNPREQLNLLIRGEEWVTRKVEEALGLAPQVARSTST